MKRQHHEEHANHEAWAIPYADLLTLLLALFVVMYAVSVVNSGKYRVMSESMYEAFNGTPRNIVVIAPPKEQGREANIEVPSMHLPHPLISAPPVSPIHPSKITPITISPFKAAYSVAKPSLSDIADKVRQSVQPLIDKKLIIVRKVENRLEIEIRSDILYASGQAVLSKSAETTLSSLATVLAGFNNGLRIEGYTDNKPIGTSIYPSNWELSAARSASVARLFASHGVQPERMSILGWGEYHPSADNATAAGRNLNRRVVIVVLSDPANAAELSRATQAVSAAAVSPHDPSAAPNTPSTTQPVLSPAHTTAPSTSRPVAAATSKPAPPRPSQPNPPQEVH